MVIDNISSIDAVAGGGFFGGILLGYAIKKVVKLMAVVIGLFLAGLAYHKQDFDKKVSNKHKQTLEEHHGKTLYLSPFF
jgi:uncharacterized membrane protein (Fun14 family)